MTDPATVPTSETQSALQELPPSSKLVAKTLEYEGEQTQSQLADSTLLSARTVRYGLTKLEENDLVDSRISFKDARQRIYSLDLGDER